MKRSLAATLGASTLVLGACGSADSGDAVEAERAADLPSVDADAAETDAGIDTPLGRALDAAAAADSFRTRVALGLDFDLGVLGQTITTEADLATPGMVVEVDDQGQQHLTISSGLVGTTAPLAGGSDDPPAALFESWLDGGTLTVEVDESGPYSDLLDGAIDAGEPFTVDLATLGDDVEARELLDDLGTFTLDPVLLVESLNERFAASATADGDTYQGTLSFADFVAALNQPPENLLGGLGAMTNDFDGLDILLPLADVAADVTVDVEVTLVDGELDMIRFDADLSPIVQELPKIIADATEAAGDAEIGAALPAEFFADAEFIWTLLADFDFDDTIDVVVPAGDFFDATDAMRELLDGHDDG